MAHQEIPGLVCVYIAFNLGPKLSNVVQRRPSDPGRRQIERSYIAKKTGRSVFATGPPRKLELACRGMKRSSRRCEGTLALSPLPPLQNHHKSAHVCFVSKQIFASRNTQGGPIRAADEVGT